MLYKNEKIDNNFETKLPRKIYKHKIKTYVIITTITLLVGVNIKKKKDTAAFHSSSYDHRWVTRFIKLKKGPINQKNHLLSLRYWYGL